MHPQGFDFATQRQIVILRKVEKLKWKDIAKKVRNLQNKRPRPLHCANYYHSFNSRIGRRKQAYNKCGRTPYKVTPAVVKFLIRRLKALRRTSPCTSVTLQQELAREMKVVVTANYIRKVLTEKGCRWLPLAAAPPETPVLHQGQKGERQVCEACSGPVEGRAAGQVLNGHGRHSHTNPS